MTHPVHSPEWFEEAFTNESPVPLPLRKASERMCREFNICGVCDPMYIANIAALELGIGDGRSHFTAEPGRPEPGIMDKLTERLSFSYSTCLGDRRQDLRPLLQEELAPAKWLNLQPSDPEQEAGPRG